MNNLRFHILLALCVVLAWGQMSMADGLPLGTNEAQIIGFQASGQGILSETDADGKPIPYSWRLNGKHADVRAPVFELTSFRLEVEIPGREKLVISSPFCQFDQKDRKISSTSPVVLDGQGLRMTGLGYDIFLQDQDVIVVFRQVVSMDFDKENISRLKESRLR
jgi:hypothetical protein